RLEAALQGNPSDFEMALVAGDGSRLDARVYLAPLVGLDGVELTGVLMVVASLVELRQAEARYEGLMGGLASAVVVTDAAGWYLDANPAACALLGYPREELLQMRVADLVVQRPEAAEDQ